jgi:hypothetical protein
VSGSFAKPSARDGYDGVAQRRGRRWPSAVDAARGLNLLLIERRDSGF